MNNHAWHDRADVDVKSTRYVQWCMAHVMYSRGTRARLTTSCELCAAANSRQSDVVRHEMTGSCCSPFIHSAVATIHGQRCLHRSLLIMPLQSPLVSQWHGPRRSPGSVVLRVAHGHDLLAGLLAWKRCETHNMVAKDFRTCGQSVRQTIGLKSLPGGGLLGLVGLTISFTNPLHDRSTRSHGADLTFDG